jgi:PAS domain S-box-containing protein
MEIAEKKAFVIEQCATNEADLKEKIRVLHVDDDLCLLKIAKQCLEMEGRIQVDMVVSVDEALVKLQKERYDIVVSDYLMPEKDGLDFLKILRSSGNTVPFIMFTGKGREEVAIKALNLGANQYLNKVGETETVYTELAFSIKELVKTRKAEEKLRESEEKFRTLAEQCPHMIFINKDGRVVYANGKAEKTMGYTKEEYCSRDFDFLKLIAPEFQETTKSNFAKHMNGEDVPPYEYKLLTRDGKVLDVILSSKIIRYQGEPAILGAVVETTDRRQVEKAIEQSQQRFAALFHGNPEASVYVSPDFTV